MSLGRRIAIALVASVGLLLASVVSVSAEEVTGGVPFRVGLTGAAEVPDPGDPDGSGTAILTINPGLGQVCSTIDVTGIEQPFTAAHIHVGSSEVAGPVVVHLSTDGCTAVDRKLALAIIENPSAYYVNVHNAEFPAGALRGQLDR
jgi:CHRD domain